MRLSGFSSGYYVKFLIILFSAIATAIVLGGCSQGFKAAGSLLGSGSAASVAPSPTPSTTPTSAKVSPSPATPGQTVTVSGTMNPNFTATSATVSFWLFAGTATGGSYLATISTTASFVAGQASPVQVTFALPSTLTTGSYNLTAAVNNFFVANFATITVVMTAPTPTPTVSVTPSPIPTVTPKPIPTPTSAGQPPVQPAQIQTQLSVPQYITSIGHQNDALIYSGYLDATLYDGVVVGGVTCHVDPTGVEDSFCGIQKAINDAMDSGLTTYLPSGTYLITSTLNGAQSESNNNCAAGIATGTSDINGQVSAPSLVGPASGPRPLIKASSGFNGPMIHFYNNGMYNGTLAAEYVQDPIDSKAAAWDCLQYAVIRDIDLSLGGNSGAVGIWFYAAQYSYLENISIDATGGYAGIQGTAETELWVNLSVTGGQYGVMLDEGTASTITGLTLQNQTTAGLYNIGANGGTTIVGFQIQETQSSATAVMIGDAVWEGETSGPQSASLSMIDGYMSSTSQPAILNTTGVDLFLSDVYAKSSSLILVQNVSVTGLAGSGNVDQITQYSHNDQRVSWQDTPSTPDDSGHPYASVNVINGVQKSTDPTPSFTKNVGTYPSDLVLRHLPGQTPWITDSGVVFATAVADANGNYADPTGTNDSTAAIQAAIDASYSNGSNEVFLPRGDYTISGILNLPSGAALNLNQNTKIFGVYGLRTRFMAPNWAPTDGQIHPMISTYNGNGNTWVGDIWFMLDMWTQAAGSTSYNQSFVNAINWQTGRSSIQHQVNVQLTYANSNGDISSAPRKLFHVMNNGGGRWYGTQMQLCCGPEQEQRDGNSEFRTIMVDQTQAPLTIYGSNPEHQDLVNPFYQISSASNVRILGLKSEIAELSDITNSNNLMFAGITPHGQADISMTNTTNVCLANMSYYSGPNDTANIPYITNNGTVYTYNNVYSLFSVGSFSEAPFPYCGDGVCDGAENSSNCSADCH